MKITMLGHALNNCLLLNLLPDPLGALSACADPESFVRGGPNSIFFFLVDEGIEDPNITLNGSSSACLRNAI